MKYKRLFIYWLAITVFGYSGTAFAEITENNIIGGIIGQYQGIGAGFGATIAGLVVRTFWLLAIIELTWSLGVELLKESGLTGFVTTLITRIVFIGFFWYLLSNAMYISGVILNTFYALANGATGAAVLTPDNILDTGLEIIKIAWQDFSILDADSFGPLILSLVIMICFAVIAAYMALALIEFYIVVYAGIFMLGFGGSSFTKDLAIAWLRLNMMVGAKIFLMLMLTGIGIAIVQNYAANIVINSNQFLALMGAAFTLMVMVVQAPALIASMMTGAASQFGAGHALSTGKSAAAGAGALTSVAQSTVSNVAGSVAAVYQAGALGKSQSGSTIANTVKNLGSAMVGDSAGMASGSVFPGPKSTKGGRMAAALKSQRPSIQKGDSQ